LVRERAWKKGIKHKKKAELMEDWQCQISLPGPVLGLGYIEWKYRPFPSSQVGSLVICDVLGSRCFDSFPN
jgi:hypothetical protein